MKETKR